MFPPRKKDSIVRNNDDLTSSWAIIAAHWLIIVLIDVLRDTNRGLQELPERLLCPRCFFTLWSIGCTAGWLTDRWMGSADSTRECDDRIGHAHLSHSRARAQPLGCLTLSNDKYIQEVEYMRGVVEHQNVHQEIGCKCENKSALFTHAKYWRLIRSFKQWCSALKLVSYFKSHRGPSVDKTLCSIGHPSTGAAAAGTHTRFDSISSDEHFGNY